MKTPTIVSALAILAVAYLLPTVAEARKGFHEKLDNHKNFIVAHGWGPERWGEWVLHFASSFDISNETKDRKLILINCNRSWRGYLSRNCSIALSNSVGCSYTRTQVHGKKPFDSLVE